MQLRLSNFDRTPAGSVAAGKITWHGAQNPNVSTDLDGARLFLAVNRGFGGDAGRFALIYNSSGTILKQVIGVPPRNSVAMMKAPGDRISMSNAHPNDIATIPNTSDFPTIGGDSTSSEQFSVTPLGFSDYPIVHQNTGDWKHAFQNGIDPANNFHESGGDYVDRGQTGADPCEAASASSLNGATIVHVCNFETNKAHIQIVDANNNAVGNMQLPRGAHIKLRKRATDKVYASESLNGTGKWVNCKVYFNKIGYSN